LSIQTFMEALQVAKRIPATILLPLLLLAPVTACSGDDRDDKAVKAIDGTFVGKVSGMDALMAIVAAPMGRGEDRRDVAIYVSDGGQLSESLTGTAAGNSFDVKSDDAKLRTAGTLEGNSATGTVKLSDGKTVRFTASRATATAGLYDLKVSRDGQLSGASASGVGLTSKSTLRAPGSGRLKFADGKQRKFEVKTGSSDDPVRLRAGQARLIVLPAGELSGAGEGRPAGTGDTLDFFIRSPAG
jgi:hypothetical protein